MVGAPFLTNVHGLQPRHTSSRSRCPFVAKGSTTEDCYCGLRVWITSHCPFLAEQRERSELLLLGLVGAEARFGAGMRVSAT
jgi:hypothetical protein